MWPPGFSRPPGQPKSKEASADPWAVGSWIFPLDRRSESEEEAREDGFVAAANCTSATFFAQPTLASQVAITWAGSEGAMDNDPGDGALGWVWIYGSPTLTDVCGTRLSN
jgi:hypothetical protein